MLNIARYLDLAIRQGFLNRFAKAAPGAGVKRESGDAARPTMFLAPVIFGADHPLPDGIWRGVNIGSMKHRKAVIRFGLDLSSSRG